MDLQAMLTEEQEKLKTAQEQAQIWSHNASRSEAKIELLQTLIAEAKD